MNVNTLKPSARAMNGRAAQAGSGRGRLPSLTMFMISSLACVYVAGRLWQDAERRLTLIKLLDNSSVGGEKIVSVERKLEILGCKDAQNKLAAMEMELAAARSQGFLFNVSPTRNVKATGGRLLAVIGINTELGNRHKRDSIRQKWMPTGTSLKSLEQDKGIVIRFIVGRSANRGDSSDRRIDSENQETNDFLILDKHVEVSEEFATKAKNFFSVAVETWNADFYIKVDDDVSLNIDELRKLLAGYSDKPRVYFGCMKSGEVVSDENQRWYEKEWWKFGDEKSYFRHAGAQIYGLSRALAQYIYVNRDFLHCYAHEDISVGSWILGLDAEHADERRLCCSSPPKGAICSAM